MILIDPRAGSNNYIDPLRALGAPVEIVTLDFGDVAFVGDVSGIIGIELKTLHDVLSCIDSGRFAGHQLPGLVRSYDRVYLIVEGLWRPNPQDGSLEVPRRGGWESLKLGGRHRSYRELDNWLTTMETFGGIHVRRVGTEHETARVVFDLYDWFTREGEHRAHLALDRSTEIALETQVAKEGRRGRGASIFREKPSPKRVFAATLPRIGVEKSGMVAGAFGSIREMVNADDATWLKIPGVGKGIVKQIREFLEAA